MPFFQQTNAAMDLSNGLIAYFLGLLVLGLLFYGFARLFAYRKPGGQKTRYSSRSGSGGIRINKTRNPYTFQ